MNTPEALDGIVHDLIRRGLPADYARRAAAEFADHHSDLVEELQAAGMCEPEAAIEASQRLGSPRTLVKKTVREYQHRYWCGRWPLITFLLGPIPALLATWCAVSLIISLIFHLLANCGVIPKSDESIYFPVTAPFAVKYLVLAVLFLVIPSLVTFAFARVARRAALGWQWIGLVALLIGIFVGTIRWDRIGPGSPITVSDWQTSRPISQPRPDFIIMIPLVDPSWWSAAGLLAWYTRDSAQCCQLLLPAAISAMFLFRGKVLAQRTVRLEIDDC